VSTIHSGWPRPSIFNYTDENYARLAEGAVDHALATVSSSEPLDVKHPFYSLFYILEDMRQVRPFARPYDSSRPMDSYVAPEEMFKYRTPVWEAIGAAARHDWLPENRLEESLPVLAQSLQRVLRHYVFWRHAELFCARSTDVLQDTYKKVFKDSLSRQMLDQDLIALCMTHNFPKDLPNGHSAEGCLRRVLTCLKNDLIKLTPQKD
jgi:hypothetical protein